MKAGPLSFVTGLVLIVLIVVNIFGVLRFNEARGWTAHTYEVQMSAHRELQALIDAETGQRGYLLTGQTDYLDPYTRAQSTYKSELQTLRQKTADNPSQQKRIDTLEGVARKEMAELAAPVEAAKSGKLDEALGLVATNTSKRTMDEARQILSDLNAEEERLLAERSAATVRGFKTSIWVDITAGVALVFLGVLLFRLNRDIARRELLEKDLRDALAKEHEARRVAEALAAEVQEQSRDAEKTVRENIERRERAEQRVAEVELNSLGQKGIVDS